MPPAVCVLGHYERDYPRNVIVRRWLAELGYEVIEAHSTVDFPWRHGALARRVLKLPAHTAAIWVAEGGHRLVPLVKLWAKARGLPVIFDPFISRYDTRVNDRQWYAPGSAQAWIAKWQDWSGCVAADHLVFDTAEHEAYFRSHYRLRGPATVLEVAVDEEVFVRRPTPTADARAAEVLFYGTFIPLHGIETILGAAAKLKGRTDIRFTIIGRGQQYDAMRAHATTLDIPAVDWVEPMPPAALAQRVAKATVCLGIFGRSRKASSVVPNKVVQCAAMGKAIISRDSTAMARYFDETSACLVPAGDASALASAVASLVDDTARRDALGEAAHAVFEARFSAAALRPRLQQILTDNGVPPAW